MNETTTGIGFYVTARTTATKWLPLLGPYSDREAALPHVDRARRYVADHGPAEAHWWSYGTTKVTAKAGDALPVGRLNELIGMEENEETTDAVGAGDGGR
ncbi:hypothetical protein ACFY05_32330 [Microtetraspora fusca]|uniref:Uncharacterized protein n=1 Tax=Microtetraspora fusca TaxID=1997 RepID=A0ABW6VEL2_MICFU